MKPSARRPRPQCPPGHKVFRRRCPPASSPRLRPPRTTRAGRPNSDGCMQSRRFRTPSAKSCPSAASRLESPSSEPPPRARCGNKPAPPATAGIDNRHPHECRPRSKESPSPTADKAKPPQRRPTDGRRPRRRSIAPRKLSVLWLLHRAMTPAPDGTPKRRNPAKHCSPPARPSARSTA